MRLHFRDMTNTRWKGLEKGVIPGKALPKRNFGSISQGILCNSEASRGRQPVQAGPFIIERRNEQD